MFGVLLVTLDSYTDWFESSRGQLTKMAYPLQVMANFPNRIVQWMELKTTSREQLEQRANNLEKERLILLGKLQRSADLAAENMRLRQLLNASELLMDSVLVTEVIGVSPDPQNHRISVDRGAEDGVYMGQPVLDATGLMGQVTEVYSNYSQVLLITDFNHALPVQVVRNGLRSIVEGVSDFNQMELSFVSPTVDIVVGDQLVSSGLGGRYPVGYPVGTITKIDHQPGEKFMQVKVQPSAQLDRSRHLLLVFTLRNGVFDGQN